jgi:hypothetical protein
MAPPPVLCQLQSGWPQQPARRERAPARPRPAKQKAPSPREKYGLSKLSDMPPAKPFQPAPNITRPPAQQPDEVRAAAHAAQTHGRALARGGCLLKALPHSPASRRRAALPANG